MVVHTILEMRPMDVITPYLYKLLNVHIYMKVPLGLKTTSHATPILGKSHGVKL